jgi:hypothetical protein
MRVIIFMQQGIGGTGFDRLALERTGSSIEISWDKAVLLASLAK